MPNSRRRPAAEKLHVRARVIRFARISNGVGCVLCAAAPAFEIAGDSNEIKLCVFGSVFTC